MLSSLETARLAAGRGHWTEAYDCFRSADVAALDAVDLELLADCAWWRGRVEEDLQFRAHAYAGFVADAEHRRAAYAAWLLSARHRIRGEHSAASGWLRRAQRWLDSLPEGAEHGYVACSEAELALGRGQTEEARAQAERAVAIGQRCGAPGVVALGLCWHGLALIVADRVAEGTAALDEAMLSVTAGELDDHFTGWISCFAIGMCIGVADLSRAVAWTEATQAWCESLPEATPYHGLCRVRRVEIMSLSGELGRADVEATRACQEMLAFQPRLAGEAFYLAGEILRRKGDLDAAEAAFDRARELGHDPQPGLARVRLAQGRVSAAASALRPTLTAGGGSAFYRANVLATQVEIALKSGDHDAARVAVQELAGIAASLPSTALRAMAANASGRLLLADGDPAAALRELRAAVQLWRDVDLGYDAARARTWIGVAMGRLGDVEGGTLELEAGLRELARLGAVDEHLAATLVSEGAEPPGGLTARECDVLALVARGMTNRQVAEELVVSEHTVARHLSNIYTKLGVSSRTAATAYAFEHNLGRASRRLVNPDHARAAEWLVRPMRPGRSGA